MTSVEVRDQPESAARPRPSLPPVLRSTAFYILLVVIALFLVFGALTPGNRFLTLDNAFDIGLNGAGLLLLAVATTFILANGNIDLSLGANLVLSSVIASKVILAVGGSAQQVAQGIYPHEATAIVLGVAAGVLTGTAFGLLNGLLVTRLGVNSFIVTLGTMGILTGAALVMTNGSNIANLPTSLQTGFGALTVWRVPVPFLVALGLAAVAWATIRTTRFGTHVLAVGSSLPAARRAGVAVPRVVVATFTLSGFLAGVAGVIDITKFGTTALSGHETDSLAAISAAIIGGTSLFGGRASMGGAIVATFIPITLLSGFVMLDVPPFYQYIAVGTILIAAVYVDGMRRGRL
jgi:ribose transport system permease protein